MGFETGEDVTPKVIRWLESNGTADDWFLHVNLWDVHLPYRTPPEVGNRFEETPLPDPWLSQDTLDRHRSEPGIRSAQDALFLPFVEKWPHVNPATIETTADVKLMIDGYDTAITHADEHIGRVLDALTRLRIDEETAIIISADHGECLGELNAYAGHCFADACTGRVPLIIRWPGVTPKGHCNTGYHYSMDLAPTVNALVGAPTPGSWDAHAMGDAWNTSLDSGREHLVLSQLAQTCQRSVALRREGIEYLAIRTYRGAYYPFPDWMLFDLTNDPHETRDLASTRPDLVTEAAALLTEWTSTTLASSPNDDPLHTVLAEPIEDEDRYRAKLAATGRGHWIEVSDR